MTAPAGSVSLRPRQARAARLLADLDAGRRRAAWPEAGAPGGWRVDPTLKAEILELFAVDDHRELRLGDVFAFRDRATLPPKAILDGPDAVSPASASGWRIVPGGTSIRAGVYLGPDVVVMPPSFVNVGAWIGARTMIDSHVLVGSCAQIGEGVHLAAGARIGGVLEPPGARPVIVEDGAFVGAGAQLLEGVLVGRDAVIGAGVTLTGTSRLYDLTRDLVLSGSPELPLSVPPGVVVVPGVRPIEDSAFAAGHGLGLATAIIIKSRDAGTSARVALEEALR